MLIPVIPVTIPDLSKPPQAGFHFRLLLVIKLLIFAILLPILFTLVSQVLLVIDAWYNDQMIDVRHVFIADNLLRKPFWYTIAFVLMAGMATVWLPFLAPLWIVPWTILCSVTGFILEIVVIVPRMFLGYFLDCFLFGKVKKDSAIMFSRRATLILALILPVVTAFSSCCWPPLYPYLFGNYQIYDDHHNNHQKELQIENRRLRHASAAAGLS